MGTSLPTGIVMPASNDNVTRQSYENNLQAINDKLIEEGGNLEVHLAESVYLQAEEPTATNSKTLWFAIGGEANFSPVV